MKCWLLTLLEMLSDGMGGLQSWHVSIVTRREPADYLLAQIQAMGRDVSTVGPRECHILSAVEISEGQYQELSKYIGGD
jgi:hypothetical protein